MAAVPRWRGVALLPIPIVLPFLGATQLGVLAGAMGQERGALIALLAAPLLFAAVVAFVHVFLLWTAPGDPVLFPLAAALAAIGLIGAERLGPAGSPVGALTARQGVAFLLGAGALVAVVRFLRLDWLRRYKYTWLSGGLALMALTSLVGEEVNGARLWLAFGPLRFQPSEPVKVALVVFLAAYLVDRRDVLATAWRVGGMRLPPLPYLIPMGLMGAFTVGMLAVQNDLGSALLLFGTFLALFWIAVGDPRYLLFGGVGLAVASWLSGLILPRIGIRMQNWVDPWAEPLSTGYQQVQAEYALAAGGAFGVGLGAGSPRLIPDVRTDFALAALGEELGLVGALGVLLLHLLLVLRGFQVSLRAADDFRRLLAAGITVSLGLQTVIIAGGVVRVLPLTGLPLPFVSYGGSSLIINLVALGLLYRVSADRVG